MSRAEERRQAGGEGGGQGKFYLILGGIAVIGAVIVGQQIAGGPGEASTAPDTTIFNNEELVELAQPVTRGDPDHPISIMLFVDYQCPSCQQFAAMLEPQIDVRFVETGRANLEQYDFPLINAHPHAFLAARAARCAGDQGRYKEYHDILFRNQHSWFFNDETVGTFSDYAGELELDEEEFDGCLMSDRHAQVVSANLQLGMGLGISGTPSVLLQDHAGGRILRMANSVEALEETISEIEGAGRP